MLNILGKSEDGYTKNYMPPMTAVDAPHPDDVKEVESDGEGMTAMTNAYGSSITLEQKDFDELKGAVRGDEVEIMVKGNVNSVSGGRVEITLWKAKVEDCESKPDMGEMLKGKK